MGADGLYVGFNHPECGETCYTHDGIYSTDGVEWHVASAPPGTFANAYVSDVTPYGDGFAAVGEILNGAGTVTGAVWLSDDGTSWRLIDSASVDLGHPFPVCEGHHQGVVVGTRFGQLEAVAAVGSRLLVIGRAMTGERECRPEVAPIFLTSDDAMIWETSSPPAGWSASVRTASVRTIVGADEFVVSDFSELPEIWRSGDGISWAKAAIDAPKNSWVAKLLTFRAGYMALGGYAAQRGRIVGRITWSSDDGHAWNLAGQEQLAEFAEAPSLAVVVRDTIFAAGVFGFESGDADSVRLPISGVTTTADGVTWSSPETSPFLETYFSELASNGNSLLLVGQGVRAGEIRVWVKSLD